MNDSIQFLVSRINKLSIACFEYIIVTRAGDSALILTFRDIFTRCPRQLPNVPFVNSEGCIIRVYILGFVMLGTLVINTTTDEMI